VSLAVGAGRAATVDVPATSANLGPGYDCLGLALGWTDRSSFTTLDRVDGEPQIKVEVSGEGAGRLPADERNLMVSSLMRGLDRLDARLDETTALQVTVHNTIPQGRGLGSSSAAIVAGLAGAHALVRPDDLFDPVDWLPLADLIEGHPDNVAAALYGGLTLAYQPVESDGMPPAPVTAVRIGVHPGIRAVALVPDTPLATVAARSVLPDSVPHADAAANAGRVGLLVHALSSDPDLLFQATVDWLHQDYRAPAMPQSAELVARLRKLGIAAVISGAGPTVLALGWADALAGLSGSGAEGFRAVACELGDGVRVNRG
jgi:homoserine kinase